MKQKLISLLTLLLCVCSGAWAQTLIEADDMETTSGSGSSMTVSGFSKGDCTISQSTEARTGSYSLKTEYNGTGDKAVKSTNASINVTKDSYLHVIGYAKMESTDETAVSTSNQAGGNSYVGGNGKGAYVNVKADAWLQFTSAKKSNSNNQTSCYVLLQRKHSAKKAVLFDDVVIYLSTNATTDIIAPSAATSASATATSISWTNGADSNTGIQNTLIFKRTNGSAEDLTLNDQGVYAVSSTDQSGNWTLVSASVAADATSYSGTFTSGDVYAIVHRDLAYNYSTPTYVTIPATGAYTLTKGSPSNGTIGVSATSADENDEITLTATPNTGYEFASWVVTKDDDDSNVTSTYVEGNTLTMPAFNVTVNATFSAINYAVTANIAEHGNYSVKIGGTDVTTAKYGQTITLAATPDSGYELNAWNVTETVNGDVVSVTNNQFTMPAAAVTIAPVFTQLTCAMPVISPSTGSTFSGASQEITITCATEGSTIHYTLDGEDPTELSEVYDSESKPSITSNTTIKAIAVKAGYLDSEVASATIKKVVVSTWGSWDFTNWSSATLTGIGEDDTNWSKYEKYDSSKDVESSDLSEKVWTNKVAVNGTLKFGETTIPETSELQFNIATHTLGVTYNQSSTDIAPGGYHGSKYLWLYSSNAKLIIPNVPAGATIKIGVESHKLNGTADATRTLTVTNTNEGTIATEAYIEATFTVSSTGNVQISPSKGMHIYYITVTANVETEPITLSYAKGTYVTTKKLNFSGIDGLTAYVAKSADASGVTMTSVGAVPEGTPLLLSGSAGSTYNVPVAATATAPETNLLLAGDGTTEFDGTTSDYILYSDGKFYQIGSGTVATNKAYLHLTTPLSARSLSVFFDDEETVVTGITELRDDTMRVKGAFNLRGQRVAQPSKGLYIVNGKKYIVK